MQQSKEVRQQVQGVWVPVIGERAVARGPSASEWNPLGISKEVKRKAAFEKLVAAHPEPSEEEKVRVVCMACDCMHRPSVFETYWCSAVQCSASTGILDRTI